jgi:hypothetical protein
MTKSFLVYSGAEFLLKEKYNTTYWKKKIVSYDGINEYGFSYWNRRCKMKIMTR